MDTGETAFIGLGGNVGAVRTTFDAAQAALRAHPGITHVRCSPLFRTPPWGPVPQSPYINAVLEVRTSLEAAALLNLLLQIERQHGRDRATEQRWGPRTLDLDLLCLGAHRIDSPALQLPHPRLAERAFVLMPWAALAPDWVVPGQGSVSAMLGSLDCSGIEAIP